MTNDRLDAASRGATDAYIASAASEAYVELQEAISEAALRLARDHVDDFPGLLEFIQDNVLFVVGRPVKQAHGWFSPESWSHGVGYATEIYISAHRRNNLPPRDLAGDILTTVIHELAHAQSFVDGIQDTSRQGRWHNKHFGMTALALGAEVAPHPRLGHVTPGLHPRTVARYRNELQRIEQALVLIWSPNPARHPTKGPGRAPATAGGGAASERYVIATCQCVDGRGNRRTIRVANGWWPIGPITCGVCETPFAP